MEIAGRAGGLIPTNNVTLRDLALYGSRSADELSGSSMERDPTVVDELFGLYPVHPTDVFVIASNSGVNGSIVGMALAAKQHGHKVIAVTSLAHTAAVVPKHPSGQRLSEVADVVLDNRAPYGDSTIDIAVDGSDETVRIGAVSSLPGKTAIADDCQEPGTRVTIAVAVEVADCSEHGVLNRVLRIVLVPKQIAGERIRVVQMRDDDSLESLDISLRHQGWGRVRPKGSRHP